MLNEKQVIELILDNAKEFKSYLESKNFSLHQSESSIRTDLLITILDNKYILEKYKIIYKDNINEFISDVEKLLKEQ